jgi:hypothetical protein
LPIILAGALFALPLEASNPRAEFDAQVGGAIAKINREGAADEGTLRLMGLIQNEFEIPMPELEWALEQKLQWGDIAAFAYICATTGRTFAEISSANAANDLWGYTEKAGMNAAKMAHSLEQFLKQAEKERNSQIFERMRISRRVPHLPDLGSGFGLFQEALDFRRIDSPRPTKIHTIGPGVLAKGDQ